MRLRITASLPFVFLFIVIAASGLTAQTNDSKRTAKQSSSPAATPQPETTLSATSSPSPTQADAPQNPVSTVQPKVTNVVSGHLELDDIFVVEVDHLAE